MGLPRFRRVEPVDVPKLLERLGIKFERVQRTKLVAFCPHPSHDNKRTPAWFIRDDARSSFHATHCCKSCGFSGTAASLVGAVLGLDRAASFEWLDDLRGPRKVPLRVEIEIDGPRIPGIAFKMPSGIVPIRIGISAKANEDPLRYLLRRGVHRWQIVEHRIGWVPENAKDADGRLHRLRGRIVFPFEDDLGIASYTARAVFETKKRYLEPQKSENARPSALFGLRRTDGGASIRSRIVVVCEGVFDALSVERAIEGSVAIALHGSYPHPSQLRQIDEAERVIVATDNDRAGEKAWEMIRESLAGKVELRRARPPERKDLGDMTASEAIALIEPHLRGIV